MTSDELKEFKSSLSITTVAKALGISVDHGRCRCLFPERHSHGDRTPSVSISEERGTFRCWVCEDVRGDAINLVQLSRGCSFLEALEWLKETFPFLAKFQTSAKSSGPSVGATKNSSAIKQVQSARIAPPAEDISSESSRQLVSEDERKKIILAFLKMLSPVENTPAAAWLVKRRIFKPVWDKMLLRTIVDYKDINEKLKATYSIDVLKYVGLFNDKGNLRYYKHPLIFPYLDKANRSFYFQARAIDKTVVPKELNLRGTVPYPYNMSALDGKVGWVYLCEGAVDTLTFIGRSMNAVGIPGVRSFKTEWLPLFKNKNVVLCLDNDDAGRSGMDYLQQIFTNAGIRVIRLCEGTENLPLAMKEGEDINDWFGGKRT